MSIFELLFIVLFMTAVAIVGLALWLAVHGELQRATRLLLNLLIGALVYMAVVVAVSLVLPREVLSHDARQCFDDWCLAVADVQKSQNEGADLYSIDIRISSRARRVSQREKNLHVYLTDAAGRRYSPTEGDTAEPFSILLGPGDAVTVRRTFDVPAGTAIRGLIATHEGGFPIGWFIIGYSTWFRKPPLVELQ